MLCLCVFLWPVRVSLFAWLCYFASARARRFRFSVRCLRVALGEARRHFHRQTALQLPAPTWRSSSSGCDSPWLWGRGGCPSPQAAWGDRAVTHQGRRGSAPLLRKRAADPRTQTARSRRTPPRATRRASSAWALGVQLARFPARERALRRATTGTSPRRAPGTSPQCATGMSPRRATGAVWRTKTRARARS